MARGVVLSVHGTLEAQLVSEIDRSGEAQVVRRCADMTEVLAAVAARIGAIAVLDVRSGVNRSHVVSLRQQGAIPVVLCPSDQVNHWRSLGAVSLSQEISPAELATQIVEFGRDGVTPPAATVRPVAQTRHAKVTLVTGPIGTGKSTIALSLARAFAAAGQSTVVVDTDIWRPALALMTGQDPDRPGLASLTRRSREQILTYERIQPTLRPLADQLHLIGGLARPRQWREVNDDTLIGLVDGLSANSHQIVLDGPALLVGESEAEWDTGPSRNRSFAALLGRSDRLIVVGQSDVVGLARLIEYLDELKDHSGLEPVVVVNRVRRAAAGRRTTRSLGQILHEYAGVERAYLVPDDSVHVDQALLRGEFLGDRAPESEANQAILRLASDLAGEPVRGRRGTRKSRKKPRHTRPAPATASD